MIRVIMLNLSGIRVAGLVVLTDTGNESRHYGGMEQSGSSPGSFAGDAGSNPVPTISFHIYFPFSKSSCRKMGAFIYIARIVRIKILTIRTIRAII